MDREELQELVNAGTVWVKMNSGDVFKLERDQTIISDLCVHVLHRSADGRLRAKLLPLVAMSVADQEEIAG